MHNEDFEKRDKQKEIMKNWFLSKYEDPVKECPYDGREGGYQYIYGGPYNANEILSDKYCSVYPEDVIQELVEELNNKCFEWSAKPTNDWYEDYEYTVTEPYQNFINHIEQINELTNLTIDSKLKKSLLKMLFVSIITAMETYLKDTFIINLFESDTYINNFLDRNKEINEQKYSLKNIKEDSDFINNKIKKYLASKMWHNLRKVDGLYREAFDKKLCLTKDLVSAVEKRHDIVHRNGKTKDGKEVKISKEDVINMKSNISDFITDIEDSLDNIQVIHKYRSNKFS